MPKLLKEKFKALDNLLTGFTELIESKYPLESKLILKDLVENSVINKYKHYSELIFCYENAPTHSFRRQVLSLVPTKYKKESVMKAFNVSKNLVDYARKHAKEIGSGITAEIKPIIRERIDPLKVEFFLDFICQGNYLQDVAYGHRLLKITDNYSISIPNVVRTANNSKIVNDYMIICKQLNMIPLSKSVCFKILKECSASFSKSLKGLDNMYADGLDAFDKLEDLFQLCSNIDQMNNLRCVLKTSKNYLKFEIKSHLSYSNECADHCASYAL